MVLRDYTKECEMGGNEKCMLDELRGKYLFGDVRIIPKRISAHVD
jgi:hypothetical protein